MKISYVKYMLLAFSVGVLCTDAQALTLSRKTKALLKSGALGSAYTALALGAGYVVKNQYYSVTDMQDILDDNDDDEQVTNIARTAGMNSLLTGLIAGYVATKSAYNAFSYFKKMKALKNQDFSATEQVTAQLIQ